MRANVDCRAAFAFSALARSFDDWPPKVRPVHFPATAAEVLHATICIGCRFCDCIACLAYFCLASLSPTTVQIIIIGRIQINFFFAAVAASTTTRGHFHQRRWLRTHTAKSSSSIGGVQLGARGYHPRLSGALPITIGFLLYCLAICEPGATDACTLSR
jgi:hypothetical protein